MKRALILMLFLFLSTISTKAATTLFPPLQPIGGNAFAPQSGSYNNVTNLPNPFTVQPNLKYPDVTKIEQTLFGNTYTKQDITIRLSRIERSMFSATYPGASVDQRVQNIIMNFNQINQNPNISQNVLSRIEAKVLNQKFPQNSAQRRIERLEEQVFGAVQSGDLDTRYQNLLTASKKFNNLAQNSIVPSTGWRGIVQNLGNSFVGGGYVTGVTPPINPYYGNYSPSTYGYSANPFGNGSGIYRGIRTNTGMYDGFQDFGSGAGVNILD